MKKFLCVFVCVLGLAVSASGADYTVVSKINRPYKGRHRVLLKIHAPNANTGEAILETMMDAAMDVQAKHGAHAVNVKLHRDVQGSADGIITYSVDGCGWADKECNVGNWSGVMVWDPYRPGRMVFDKIPDRLKDYGRPTEKRIEAAKANACRADLQCWGDKHHLRATVYCKEAVERLARYAHKWTDGWLGAKFPRFRWGKKSEGIIVYLGDKAQFQNGFGAWVRIRYQCEYNPDTKAARAQVFAR